MLLDTMNKSITAIQATKEARNRKQSADNFSKSLSTLSGATAKLVSILDCIDALHETGVYEDVIITAEDRESLLQSLNTCGNMIQEGSLTSGESLQLVSYHKLLDERISALWKSASIQYASGSKGYLAMVWNLTPNPTEAKKVQEDIDAACNAVVSKSTVQKLKKSVCRAKDITDAFHLQPVIEDFLVKVKTGKASVVDLTPEVMAWLQDNQLTGRLQVRF